MSDCPECKKCKKCKGTGKTEEVMSDHTPGPWELLPEPGGTFDVQSENGYVLALVFDTADGNGPANARLIASAPALLAALDGLLEAHGEREGYIPGRTVRCKCPECAAARAAIAAAKGETP
jgi:hypothetical protein